jgi:uracil-DNA glycosylase family 4
MVTTMREPLKSIRNPHCTMCKLHKTAEYVCLIGRGPTPCDVMIVGEAPGKREDDNGEAFVGPSGKVLDNLLKGIGLSRSECYISNAVHCRPLNNKTPTKREIEICRHYLDQEIKMVKPKYIVTLGNTPLLSLTGEGRVKKRRGKPFELNGVVMMPMLHPATMLYDPANEYYLKRDFEKLREVLEFGGIPYERNVDYVVVDSWRKVDDLCEALLGTVSSDCETSGLYPWKAGSHIVSVGFGTRTKQWIIPIKAQAWKSPWTMDDLEIIFDRITEKLEDCYVVGHNWKFDRLWLRKHMGIDIKANFDTMLAHYMINENDRHGLDHLASFYFGAPDWDVPLELKQGLKGKFDDHCLYLAQDLYFTRKLRFRLQKELDKDHKTDRLFQKIMMPCADMFADVEWRGVYIDTSKFDIAEDYLKKEMAAKEKELKKYGDINWGSPKQVGELLYGKLKVPIKTRTKTGAASTSESALNEIDHPCVAALIAYRGAKQQLSFFIEGWKPYLVNNRLHPSFKLHGTVTGRLSCENPNLQQVPRDPRIRSLITAPPGWTLLEADLSQIELRVAAHMSQDRTMLKAFADGIDTHWLTAMREISRGGGKAKEVLETARTITGDASIKYGPAIQVLLKAGPDACAKILPEWKELRKKAKAINFGYLFGMWWKKFKIYARDTYGVILTDKEAEESRVAFFDLYTDLPDWHNAQKHFARVNGYVESLSGRKRRLPDAMGRDNTPQRQEAERQAINSPVQSFANELNLMAALQLRKEFSKHVVQLVGTVHDAVLVEVRNDWVPRVYKRVLKIMSYPELMDELVEEQLDVEIEAEAKLGAWSTGVKLDEWRNTHE